MAAKEWWRAAESEREYQEAAVRETEALGVVRRWWEGGVMWC